MSYFPANSYQEAVIPDNQAISGAVALGEGKLAGLVIPADWVAADITFQVSPTLDGDYQDLYDAAGDEYTVVVVDEETTITIPVLDFLGVRFLKVRSGTSASPVNQTDGPITVGLLLTVK